MDEFKKDLRDVEKNIIAMLNDLQDKYDIFVEDIDIEHSLSDRICRSYADQIHVSNNSSIYDVKINIDVR